MKNRSIRWGEIETVAKDQWIVAPIFHLIPKDARQRKVIISSSIRGHREILAEVIKRTPQAEIDEEIFRYVEKKTT
ncbi:MAG: hypothetical protein ACM3MK_00035 [Chitinophagales bacterium]